MKTSAEFSKCEKYRYALWRIWDESKPVAMIIGLNPSTADAENDDPTIRRCKKFAEFWGYGGVCMANLFAFRATEPSDMMKASDPIGPENDEWLVKLAKDAGVVVAAWSSKGRHLYRSSEVRKMFPELHYIKLNKSGEPAHPLYLKGDLPLQKWQ